MCFQSVEVKRLLSAEAACVVVIVIAFAIISTSCRKEPLSSLFDASVDASPSDATIDANLMDATIDANLMDVNVSDADLLDASTDANLVDGSSPADAQVGDGGGTPTCPLDMMLINGNFCIDIWEASRPDATALYPGIDSSYAVSAPNRYPWFLWSPQPVTEAEQACTASVKRLCEPAEWETACSGSQQTIYGYGNTYEATTCNGIDVNCNCSNTAAACASLPDCPTGNCYAFCGGTFGVAPTGSFPGCVNDFGLYDISGNLWEVVNATGLGAFRGGAFNCYNSVQNTRCDFIPTWDVSAKGFRCCSDPQ